MLMSRWFSVMKQLLGCTNFEIVTLLLHNSTFCIGMLWVLAGFHVRSLSEQHDTLHHPSGGFFWKFVLLNVFPFFLLRSFGLAQGNLNPKVFGVNVRYISFIAFNAFDPVMYQTFDRRCLCSVFQGRFYPPTSDAGISRRADEKTVFLPKKYIRDPPHPPSSPFLSSLESCTVS